MGLKLAKILLFQPPAGWDHRRAPPRRLNQGRLLKRMVKNGTNGGGGKESRRERFWVKWGRVEEKRLLFGKWKMSSEARVKGNAVRVTATGTSCSTWQAMILKLPVKGSY